MTSTDKAATLIEALPYLQSFRGSTFLIKMGGSAMDNPELVAQVMRDIVFLEVAGINPIIVHGGGKAISAAMQNAGLEANFIGGFRVTTPEAISIVEKTLSNTINPHLVSLIKNSGAKAVGIPGTDLFIGERIKGKNDQGELVDIGRVGQVIHCKKEKLQEAIESETVPVISPLASEQDTAKPLNVNADLAAAALAKELQATKLIYLSDVPGVMQDPSNADTLIPSITAIDAINHGVKKVHFIDGRRPHSLLLEIFTQSGIGTEITQ